MPTDWMNEFDNAVQYIRTNTARMKTALRSRGWPITPNSDMAAVAQAVEEIAAAPLTAFGCAITVRINTGSGVYVPDEPTAAALLDGATVQIIAGMNSASLPLTSLQPGTTVSHNLPLTNPVPGIVRIRLNAAAVRGTGISLPEIRCTFAPGAHEIALDVVKGAAPAGYNEIGFRVFDDMSFSDVMDLIVTVGDDGVASEADTGYLDAVTGKWVSTSPIERGLPQVSPATGEIVGWNRCRTHMRNDLFGIAAPNEEKPTGVWPFNACKPHTYIGTAADGTQVVNRLMAIGDNGAECPHWYIKTVHTVAPLRTRQADGRFTETAQNVTEWYIAEIALDAGYRRVEIDYIGVYHNSRRTLSFDGSNKSVEFSDATGYGPDIGIQRFRHQENTERVNDLPGAATFDGRAVTPAPRAVSLSSYHDWSCLLPLIVMACGTRNGQAYTQGHTSPFTDVGPDNQREIGVTKPISDLNLPIGTLRSPDVAGCFLMFGIENVWGNIGTFFPDLTNIGGTFWYCSDRSKWMNDMTPREIGGVTVAGETLLQAYGYRALSVVPRGGFIRAMLADDDDPDLLVPATPAVGSLPASSGTCYADECWLGTSSGTSYLCAAGVSRSSGFSLGPFCVYAYHGWSTSDSNGWSGRVSLAKTFQSAAGR